NRAENRFGPSDDVSTSSLSTASIERRALDKTIRGASAACRSQSRSISRNGPPSVTRHAVSSTRQRRSASARYPEPASRAVSASPRAMLASRSASEPAQARDDDPPFGVRAVSFHVHSPFTLADFGTDGSLSS